MLPITITSLPPFCVRAFSRKISKIGYKVDCRHDYILELEPPYDLFPQV